MTSAVLQTMLLALGLGALTPIVYASPESTERMVSSCSVDVNGDGRPDKLTYTLKRSDEPDLWEATLRIRGANRRLLWDDGWYIRNHDVIGFVSLENEFTSLTSSPADWVRLFFSGRLYYGPYRKRLSLRRKNLDDGQIQFAASRAGTSTDTLRRWILEQAVNYTFSYRAEWKEDLVDIVYVPQLRKFVCYHRGYD